MPAASRLIGQCKHGGWRTYGVFKNQGATASASWRQEAEIRHPTSVGALRTWALGSSLPIGSHARFDETSIEWWVL
jgi:hypothetical protein